MSRGMLIDYPVTDNLAENRGTLFTLRLSAALVLHVKYI